MLKEKISSRDNTRSDIEAQGVFDLYSGSKDLTTGYLLTLKDNKVTIHRSYGKIVIPVSSIYRVTIHEEELLEKQFFSDRRISCMNFRIYSHGREYIDFVVLDSQNNDYVLFELTKYIQKQIDNRYRKHNKPSERIKPSPPRLEPHPTDEIRRYKKLMDDGLITESEYQQVKKRLLGI